LASFMELPFFSNSSKTSLGVTQALLDKKLISKEFEKFKVLFPVISPPAQIFSNKLFNKVEEFKGIRIMCAGSPLWPKTMGLLGGQCVTLPIPEVYVALERGTLDAGVVSWANSKGWRWVEVIKYPLDINMMGGFVCLNVMNKNSWAKLPPEVQTAWSKVFEKYASIYAAAYDSQDQEGRKIFTDAGKKIIKISDAERERFAAKVMPVWQDWINANEKAGRPGKEIYKTYLQVMKQLEEPVAMKIPGL
jgi:TRAP-type transport system periplasmic protein